MVSVTKVFNACAIGTGILAAVLFIRHVPLWETTPPVPLREGEAALVKAIFAEEIDTTVIRKHRGGCQRWGTVAEVSSSKDIYFCNISSHSDDFSRERDAFNYAVFMHETTHIWQRQNSYNYTNGRCQTYEYSLSPELPFTSYCNEQQAAIVMDYALRFIYFNPEESFLTRAWRDIFSGGKPASEYAADTPRSDFLLQKIVEDQFPQARVTRLALEAKRARKTIIPHIPIPMS